MNKIKILVVAGILLLSTVFFAPKVSLAATSEELQTMIASLMQQIKTLQAQLGSQQTTTTAWCHTFKANIKIGNAGNEVKALQTALQKEGFEISDSAGTFGEPTASAVVEFQEKYRSEILTPYNLNRGTGYVGLATRTKLNKLYGCGATTTTTPVPVVNVGSPVISGVSGPTALSVGQTGTWTVTASDPNQEALSYLVSYGDEAVNEASATSFYRPGEYVQTATFTHSYATAGTFKPTFTVTNEKGLFAKSSLSVNVGGTTATPSVTVTSPNGGETWQVGFAQAMRWNTGSDSSIKNVHFTLRDAKDSSGYDLHLGAPNTGSLTFTLPSSYRVGTYFLQVKKTDGTLLDESDATFNVVAAGTVTPSITVTSPNGGEVWKVGETRNITWNFNNVDKVSLWRCNTVGSSKSCVPLSGVPATGIENVGFYNWLISSNDVGNAVTIRVASEDNYPTSTVYDDSNALFSIVAADSATREITISSPEAGASWAKGTTHEISWSSTGVKWIDIKLMKSGNLALTIASRLVASTTNSYSWNIPLSVSNGSDYKIRLDSGDDKIKDSNAFTISGISEAPTITSLSKTEEVKGAKIIIYGTNFKSKNTVVFAGQQLDGPSTDGVSIAATVPALVVGDYYVSVKNINGESGKVIFNVKDRRLTVTSPNGGEVWAKGSTYNITWDSLGVDTVDLVLRKGTVKVKDIATGISASSGSRSWKVPTDLVVGEDYKIKLISGDGILIDTSDANFSVIKATTSSGGTTINISQMAGALASMTDILKSMQSLLNR